MQPRVRGLLADWHTAGGSDVLVIGQLNRGMSPQSAFPQRSHQRTGPTPDLRLAPEAESFAPLDQLTPSCGSLALSRQVKSRDPFLRQQKFALRSERGPTRAKRHRAGIYPEQNLAFPPTRRNPGTPLGPATGQVQVTRVACPETGFTGTTALAFHRSRGRRSTPDQSSG